MTVDCRQKALARKVFLLVSHRQPTYLATVMEVKVFLLFFFTQSDKCDKNGVPNRDPPSDLLSKSLTVTNLI